ncbi:MAG: DUF937 domain-containing protein [Verrucomicrobiota bacterium]
MSDLLDELHHTLGADVQRELGGKYNLSPEQSKAALDKIGPLIFGGLKRQMQDHGGEERLEHIVNKYGDRDGVNRVNEYFSQRAPAQESGDPGLGGLLGDSGHEAASQLDKGLSLPSGLGAKLIPMLAPLILGMLASKAKAGGGGGSSGGGASLGGLGALIDRDGDGSILDDVGGILFNQATGGSRRSGSSGCLGLLLGRLLGGGR